MTLNKNNVEYLCITKIVSMRKYILQNLPTVSLGSIMIERYAIMEKKFTDLKIFMLSDDRLKTLRIYNDA